MRMERRNINPRSHQFSNMKSTLYSVCVMALLCWSALGQGTFIYDQQSAPNDYTAGEGAFDITLHQPAGQSFVPTLDSVEFVRLQMEDPNGGGVGATLLVNLWFGSIGGNGTILGSSDPVFLPPGFGLGTSPVLADTNIFFTTPVTVTPGQTYYLQPVVQSGDDIYANVTMGDSYPNGSLILSGTNAFGDLWFREGVYQTPEPWSWSLILLGGGILFCFGSQQRRRPSRVDGGFGLRKD